MSLLPHLIMAALLSTASSFAQVAIDNFEKNQASGTAVQAGAMLGGERDIAASGSATAEVKGGTLRFSSTGAGSVDVVWDGADGGASSIATAGLGTVDLTSGSHDAFLLGVNSSDAAVTIVFTVYSGPNTKTYTLPVPGLITTPTWYQVAYSDLGWSGSASFSSAGAIRMTISSSVAANVVIDVLRTSSTAAPATPEATLTDVLLVDADNNGKASGGDTLKYIARIRNTGGTALSNVQFSAPAVANASAAVNITATPLAHNDAAGPGSAVGDAYHTAFNSTLTVGDGDADEDLLNNDFVGQPAGVITKFGGGTLGGSVDSNDAGSPVAANGHSLTVNSDGSFSYTPATGFTGLFTFEYRLANPHGSSTATVTIVVGTRPDAHDDAYSALGNVQITRNAATGVLLNGTADRGDAIAVTTFGPNLAAAGTYSAGSAGLTAQNGNLTLNADGSFSYNPAPGFSGTDSFVYKIDNGFATPDSATVTITVGMTIWFIDNSASAGGDGRLITPFNTLTAYSASLPAKDDGDIIFIYQGSGNYSGSITLVNNQKLIGQGEDLVAVAGLTVPPGSATLPGQSSKPVLANAGTIVTLPGSGGASSIRGLTLSPTAGYAISGNSSGPTTLTNNTITPSAAGGGVSLTAQAEAFTATSTPITASGSSAAVLITGGSGNISFDASSGLTQSGAARVVDIQNRTGGTITIAGNIAGSGSNKGIYLANNNAGAPTITFSGAAKALNTGANAAITLSGNSGATIDFTGGGLDIDTTSGAGLSASSGGTLNIQGSNNSITTGTGTGLGLSSVNAGASGITFDSVISTSGQVASISTSTGTKTLGRISTSSGGVSALSLLSAGTVNVGTSTATKSTVTSGASAGAVVLNATTLVLDGSGSNDGLNVTATSTGVGVSCTGGTVTISGGQLNITTSSGTGFSASNGGTVNVLGAGNRINASSGTGLKIENTTIGGSDVTFESISSGTGANAGIILDNTGSSGRLLVTGLDGLDGGSDPDAGSGGTIHHKTGGNVTDNLYPATISGTTGVGIFLRSTLNPSFAGMQLNDFSNFAVLGSSVNGFTLSYSVINGVTGDDINNANDAVVHMQELTGVALVKNCTIQGGIEDNMRVVNTSGTLNRLTFDTVTFGAMDTGNTSGDNSLFIQGRNSAVVNVTIQDSSFTSARGDLFQLNLADSATGDLMMKRNTFANTHPNILTGGGGVVLSGGGSATAAPTLTYDIGGATGSDGNSFSGARGSALLVLFQSGAGSATGKVRHNTFGKSGIDKSGSIEGSDIEIRTTGRAAQTTLIDSNDIRQYGNFGVYLQMGDQNVIGSQGTIGALNATVSNNTIAEPNTTAVSNKNGVHANIGTTSVDTYAANLDIQNNNAANSGSSDASIGTDYVIRQRQSTSIGLPGYSGSSSADTAAVISYIQNRNIGTETVYAATQNAGGSVGYFNRAVTVP